MSRPGRISDLTYGYDAVGNRKWLKRDGGTGDVYGYEQSRPKDIVRRLNAGHSIRNAAKITSKGISTVQRVKAALAA